MPVLPEVGSTTTLPLPSCPAPSIASSIDSAMRSLTLPSGLKNSSLASTSPWHPASRASRPTRTSGVLPTVSRMLS
jgi:hypothetical protein